MPRFGYARVSSTDQDLTIQIEKLKAAGRSETMSGKSADDRPELATVMQFLREGDELVVVRLDRLGRSTRDVLNLLHDLDQKGASLRILDPELTTGGDVGRIVVTVLGMVAEMERKFILERQRAGIEAAKAAGVYAGKGRPKSVPQDEIRRRHAAGEGATAIARALGVSRRSVYRAIETNDPRRVYAAGETPQELAALLLTELDRNFAEPSGE
jgi:DNA invertase Pin-like site-specific DNA recombinase